MFKLGFKGFLQSIIDRFKYLFSSEDPTPSEFSSKLGLRNIKRIFKKDFKAIRERRFREVIVRWRNRRVIAQIIVGSTLRKISGQISHYNDKKAFEKTLFKKRKLPQDFYSAREIGLNSIPETVSVVINTKGSPLFFEDILRKYKGQVGLNKIEIIIVDSGSKDNTLNLAKYYGCKIIEIKPEEFKHGRSRNIGIEAASGKYIVNAVSDATPPNLDLLVKIVNKLEKNKAAAISIRQIPRIDADLFAALTINYHYQVMFGGSLGDFWVDNIKNHDTLSAFERRRLAVIDDVFVLHRAEVIKKEKYDNDIKYAEDLDLSIRYIKKGHKFGFLNSESIIHSHTRPVEYFLKRYFVDTNFIYKVFGSLPDNLGNSLNYKKPLDGFFSIIKATEDKLSSLRFTDSSWIKKYLDYFNDGQLKNSRIIELWNQAYNSKLEEFTNFRSQIDTAGEDNKEFDSKIAALVTGIMLSEGFIRYNLRKGVSEDVEKFCALLEEGI